MLKYLSQKKLHWINECANLLSVSYPAPYEMIISVNYWKTEVTWLSMAMLKSYTNQNVVQKFPSYDKVIHINLPLFAANKFM